VLIYCSSQDSQVASEEEVDAMNLDVKVETNSEGSPKAVENGSESLEVSDAAGTFVIWTQNVVLLWRYDFVSSINSSPFELMELT
jgi:hypothetical protein